MSLIYSVLSMIRAHEESARKSQLVKDAYRKHCEGWIAGTFRGLIGAPQTDPNWLVYNREKQRFEFEPEKARTVRRAVKLYRQGYGAIDLTRKLRDEGLSLHERFPANRVSRLMTSRALIGEKLVNSGDETFALKGYYPALISEADFEEVQLIVSKRGVRRRKGDLPGVVTGLQLAYCGYCGSVIVAHNSLGEQGRGADGQLRPGARRMRCGAYHQLAKKCIAGDSCSAAPVERALMDLCSEQSNLDYFLAGDDSADPLMQTLASGHQALTSTEAKLAKNQKGDGGGGRCGLRDVPPGCAHA